MTIDILLNQILANNIIKFIQKNQEPCEKIEIKNDQKNGVHLFKKFMFE